MPAATLKEYAQKGAALRIRFFEENADRLIEISDRIARCLEGGGKLLVFGNGGSAADAQHLVAELVNRYRRIRRALPAVALTTDTSILTSVANDGDFAEVFARQIEALGAPGDAVLAISTSGKSPNILRGLEEARKIGMMTVGLTGGDGGGMPPLCDHLLIVPGNDTPLVQEIHLAAEHVLCDLVESKVDPGQGRKK